MCSVLCLFTGRCSGQVWHGADLWLCMQHGLGNALLAAYKLDFLGLDLAQLTIDDLDTIPREAWI